jgi:hypothetical protein
MKRQKQLPGAVLKIVFDAPWHTYGRMLRFGDVVVYDARTTEDWSDFEALTTAPILFRGMVNDGAVKGGQWPVVGLVPLTEPDLRHSKYFLPEVGDPDHFQLVQNGGLSFGHPRAAIAGLTYGGIWDASHIDGILQDYYAGRENVFLKMEYTDSGLPLPVY